MSSQCFKSNSTAHKTFSWISSTLGYLIKDCSDRGRERGRGRERIGFRLRGRGRERGCERGKGRGGVRGSAMDASVAVIGEGKSNDDDDDDDDDKGEDVKEWAGTGVET